MPCRLAGAGNVAPGGEFWVSQTEVSITHLQGLVERLSARLAQLGEEGDLLGSGGNHVLSKEVAGEPLYLWLRRLWSRAQWGSLWLSEAALGQLHQGRRHREESLRREVTRRRELIACARRSLQAAQEAVQGREPAVRRRLKRLQAEYRGLQAALAELRQRLEASRREATELGRWLQGVHPVGVRGFADARGRAVSQTALLQAQQRHHALTARSRRLAARLQERQAEAAVLEAELARARQELDQARDAARREAARLQAAEQRLARAEADLRQAQTELAHQQRRVMAALEMRLAHARLVEVARGLLEPLLAQRPSPPPLEPLSTLEDSLTQAARQAQRGQRLAERMERLQRRLARRAEMVTPLLRRVREVNQQIARLEGQLPLLLTALTSPEAATPLARAEAAAALSSLAAQVEALVPEAREVADELFLLRGRLQNGLDKGKRWQRQWREAGKAQRAAQAQAQAVVEDLRLAAEELRRGRRRLVQQAAPVVKTVAPVSPQEVLPTLARLVETAADLEQQAQDMEERARQWSERLQDTPPVPNLSRPPLALKPYSAALRRLSGKQVEIRRLNALAAAVRSWRELLSAPVEEAIRAPLLEVVSHLEGSLARLAAERTRLVEARQYTARRLAELRHQRRQQDAQLQAARLREAELNRQLHRQAGIIRQYEAELVAARREQALAWELEQRLAASERQLTRLARSLAYNQRLSQALRAKLLERHRLLRQARATLQALEPWRERALEQQWLLERTHQELEQVRLELAQAKEKLRAAVAERDQAREQLAREQAARARQALDLLQGQALAVELAASRDEAGRWARLAADLARSLALAGLQHQEETAELRAEIDRLAAEAGLLKEQLNRVAQLVAMAELGDEEPSRRPRPVAVRVTPLTSEQVAQALARLTTMRQRLARLGRSTLGHWLSILALTTGLVLVPPSTPTKATLAEAPLRAPRLTIHQAAAHATPSPTLDLPARAQRLVTPPGKGVVELNLLPLRPTRQPLPPTVRQQVETLAARAGLAPRVLITSARAMFAGRAAVETSALAEVAHIARALAQRHPLIFRELAHKGLPPSAAAVAALDPAPERAQQLFLDRLYREYRSLGFSPEEALGALAANEHAARALRQSWRQPRLWRGKVTPVPAVEELKLRPFLERMTPYIVGRLKTFLRQRGMRYAGDLERYAKNLAFDMYCAARKFQVPVTFLLAIAHQETWYANVLGDADRSASPFQIYEPTRHLILASMRSMGFVPPPPQIRLEHHLTMATYMAAFHLRELMATAYHPGGGKHPPSVDMDKVLKRYNGSSRYAGRVAKRRLALARFMAR